MNNQPTPSDDGWWSGEVLDVSQTPSTASTPSSFRPNKRKIATDWQSREGSHSGSSPSVAGGSYALLSGKSMNGGHQTWKAPGADAYGSMQVVARKTKMQTGCVPCLVNGVACKPSNPGCKLAMSDDWSINYEDVADEDDAANYPTPETTSLTLVRPDLKWRRNWRERHSLNFFVSFSAPQMAGFFDSIFWQRMVIQTSFNEPAIMHAITAIGALHEAIMQRAFADEKRKGQAMEFALNQCNKAIACLTNNAKRAAEPNTKLALTTCILFTAFEALQGRCDSAVTHALQGRRLLQACGRPNVTTMHPPEEDAIEQMRPLVERLEVQATALLEKAQRPETDTSDQTAPLPPIGRIYNLDHAHNTLHLAMNSAMRFMQGFHPTAPRDHIAVTMAEKYLRYYPWFQEWERAFTLFLGNQRENMSQMDLKRAMVLKANHLVGTMLASVDQSAGPAAYDSYEAEFKAIVELSREVLGSFSCPPLPTLNGGSAGVPYLSFSLWVTDPLWMAISRCRNPAIRQSAFVLLSQNPRQEGIWHTGPASSAAREKRRDKREPKAKSRSSKSSNDNDSDFNTENDDTPTEVTAAPVAGNMRVRAEWVDLRSQLRQWSERGSDDPANPPKTATVPTPPRYKGVCTGRCNIPTMSELQDEFAQPESEGD